MDTLQFIEALNDVAAAKGLTREAVIFALEEAIRRAYIKYLGGGDDAVVTCEIDPETGKVTLAQVKDVVEEVEDDYLQIEVEDANALGKKQKKKYKAGDKIAILCPVEDLEKVTISAIKNNLHARLADAERTMLYDIYKDHIGEMMTGVVEKPDEKSVVIRIDRTSIELTRKELIGDEVFRPGDPIKVYIQEVKSPDLGDGKGPRGPQIQATRSSEGFLKRLFEEEIHEVYDGTVIIKAIARQAGVRSKVAVTSNNPDIDATGSCIGQGGSRIQKIVAQLGNGKNKEKIDVVNYSPSIGAFILEAIRPAQTIGLWIDEENKKAKVEIEDGSMPMALGKFRSNLTLARKLTGYDIEFIEKAKCEGLDIVFTSVEEWKARAEAEDKVRADEAFKKAKEEEKRRAEEIKAREAALAEAKRQEELAKAEEEAEAMPEIVVKPAPAKPVPPKAAARPEEFPSSAANPAALALAAEKAAKEAAAKKAEEEAAPTEVKTTTTLESLEKELEDAKEKKTKSGAKSKRPRKITEEEVEREKTTPKTSVTPIIPIYTEEELSQIESEEAESFDEVDDLDEDYSEYDDYYDDDDK